MAKKDETVKEEKDAAVEETTAQSEATDNKKEDDASLVETVVEAATETVSDVAEAVVETAGDVAEAVTETASDVIETVAARGGDEDAGSEKTGRKRAEKVGIVFSDKMTNTVIVRVNRMVKHQLYHKYMKKRKKFMAHDELGAGVGDRVRIVETRPLSARKRWRVVEILQKAEK